MTYRLRCRGVDHDVASGGQTSHPHFDETGKTSRLGDLNQVGDPATAVMGRGFLCACVPGGTVTPVERRPPILCSQLATPSHFLR